MSDVELKSQDTSPPGTSVPEPAPSLTRQAASGVAWTGLVTVAGKATALVGQIVLTWFLMPSDFGLVALMFGVMMFVNLIREAGLLQVLMHRHSEFDRLAGPAIWISGLLGLLASGVLVAAAPTIAALLKTPPLLGMLYVMALSCPWDALSTVPTAKLQIDLRFRYSALQGFGLSLLQMAVTIVLAWRGFGAVSVAWAMVATAVVRALTTWAASGVTPFRAPAVRDWAGLVREIGVVVGSYLLYIIILQSDRFVLQVFRDESSVGIYFFAYSLSVQTIVLTSSNLAGVLMPTLSRLNGDRPRQVQAFLRAMRLMMLVGTPLCVAQAALAEPMLRWLFKPEYHVALWPVRLLSLAMVFRLAGYCAVSLLQAQGRFRTHAVVMAIQVPLWLIAASIGAYFSGATGVAVAAVVVNAIIDPTLVLLGVYRLEPTVRVADDLFVRPLMLSVLVALPIFVMLGAWGLFRSYPWLQLLLGGAVGVAGYWILLGRLMPARAEELRQHVATLTNGVRARLMRKRGTDTATVQT